MLIHLHPIILLKFFPKKRYKVRKQKEMCKKMLTLEFCLLAMTEAGELRTGLVGKLFQFLKVRSQISLLRTPKCHGRSLTFI